MYKYNIHNIYSIIRNLALDPVHNNPFSFRNAYICLHKYFKNPYLDTFDYRGFCGLVWASEKAFQRPPHDVVVSTTMRDELGLGML